MIDQARLKHLLRYEFETGNFFWRASRFGCPVRAGALAGKIKTNGYRAINVDDRPYYAHRLAWLYCYGEFPPNDIDIDHINGNKLDNRITNLRIATRSQNMHNCKPHADSSSGCKGVRWRADVGKFQARLSVSGREKNLGWFSDLEEAKAAYAAAVHKYHGDFGRIS